MRCPYCGNENPGQNRFCGMCGRPLLGEAAPTGTGPSSNAPAGIVGATSGNTEAREERQSDVPGSLETSETIPRPPEPSPAYTGGLFHLGSTDDRHPRNLDYLLEDDEKPRSWGGVFVVVLLAAALAGGIGWLRWRNGGLPGIANAITETQSDSSGTKPPAEQLPSTEHGSAESTPPQSPSPASAAPAAAPAANSAPPSSGISETPAITPVAPEPSAAPEHAAPANESKPAGTENGVPAHSEPSTPPAPDVASTPAPASAVPKAEPPAHSPGKPTAASSAPAPKVAPAVKQDPVVLGEKYLYGRGVPQSCEKGLHLVKPPSDQGIPKAMITMGALYATGHCVGRDLPTAYRFFALALRKDPENSALKQNAEMVWSQMTPTERQHAIQLTQ